MENFGELIIILAGSLIFLWIVLYFVPIGLWFQATVSGVRITLIEITFMKWRKVPAALIVRLQIMAVKAGIEINRNELEAAYLGGMDVEEIVALVISANVNGKKLSINDAIVELQGGVSVEQLIEKYQLIAHPEGGYYCEVYKSIQEVESPINKEKRKAVTHIYFLLTKGQVSRFHMVLHDEIWNFYEGAPLKIVEYVNEEISEKIIGGADKEFCHVVKGGGFQAAETTGDYSLVGCSVAPGFDFKDFSFLKDNSKACQQLKDNYPSYQRML